MAGGYNQRADPSVPVPHGRFGAMADRYVIVRYDITQGDGQGVEIAAFADLDEARRAFDAGRASGEYVDGPCAAFAKSRWGTGAKHLTVEAMGNMLYDLRQQALRNAFRRWSYERLPRKRATLPTYAPQSQTIPITSNSNCNSRRHWPLTSNSRKPCGFVLKSSATTVTALDKTHEPAC